MAAQALVLGGQLGGKLLMGLLAAHDKRMAEAKAENSAVNAALAALIHDCQLIADGFNAGAISSGVAIQSCIDVRMWYWQYVNPYTQYKNASPTSCQPDQFGYNAKLSNQGGRCFQSTQTGTNFTAASYMGCNVVDASLGMLRAALISLAGKPAGTSSSKAKICGWPANKYGLTPYTGTVLTLTVPKSVAEQEVTLSASGVLNIGAAPTANDALVAKGAITSGGQSSGFGMFGSISPNLLLLAGFGIVLAIAIGARK